MLRNYFRRVQKKRLRFVFHKFSKTFQEYVVYFKT